MLSRLTGADRIDELTGQLAALRAEVAAQGNALVDRAGAVDLAALRAEVAAMAAQMDRAASEEEALRLALEALGERVTRLEVRADDHEARAGEGEERSRAAGRQVEERAARADAEREAQRLELRKLQLRLDAHSADMAKTATALVQQMTALRRDGLIAGAEDSSRSSGRWPS